MKSLSSNSTNKSAGEAENQRPAKESTKTSDSSDKTKENPQTGDSSQIGWLLCSCSMLRRIFSKKVDHQALRKVSPFETSFTSKGSHSVRFIQFVDCISDSSGNGSSASFVDGEYTIGFTVLKNGGTEASMMDTYTEEAS
ncbi:sortase B protein-sorting domain-containing protein [Bacillus sp. SL00103]